MRTNLVFGKRWEGDTAVIFAQPHRLVALADILKAIRVCPDWGTFRLMVPADVYREAVARRGADSEPSDSDELAIGAYDDGDWPGFLEQEMLQWMPDVVQRLGIVKSSVLNGDFLHLPYNNLAEILEALTENGYDSVRDDSMLRKAMDLSPE